MPNVFRNLPSVGELLESPPLKSLLNRVNHNVIVARVRHFLDDMQAQIRTVAAGVHVPAPAELALRIADWISADRGRIVLPVINATGVILHPRLGRAPLADEVIAEMAALTRGYASFGVDLASGGDSGFAGSPERQLQRLTGADSGAITNSLASAALVSLAALAGGREVVVARGQVTSIDEGLGVPDLFHQSGAQLREAGTANITRVEDYNAAITPQTAAILHVSASNFTVVGTAEHTPLSELCALARRRGLPIIDCLTEASIVNLSPYGIAGVPLLGESIACGADVTLCAGDGFVGGPPCGIIAGRRSYLERIGQHLLMSAFRADKLTLAAIRATLRLYEDQEAAERTIPVLSLLATPLENLRQRAERLAPQIAATGVAAVEIVACQSSITGHEVPGQSLPSIAISLCPKQATADQLAAALRTGIPAVIGAVQHGRVLLDLRSVMPREDLSLVKAVRALSRTDEPQSENEAIELVSPE
jgi:L-seryl-tRNA(Ser) seleniumtransferase